MNRETPIELSVIMPVFNSELFLSDAIQSILRQSITDFEFIIVNDGSTDSSDTIIRSFNDSRINYINNNTNKGIVAVLNQGVNISSGTYIARMDADDIAVPTRFEEQLDFLKKNPEYKLCGTYAIRINEDGKKLSKIRAPKKHSNIKVGQLFRNSFVHPSIIVDSKVIKTFGYKEEYKYAEDYFLFSEIVMHYKAANINKTGLFYRTHNDSISAKRLTEMMESEQKAMRYLLSFLFDEVTEKQLILHHSLLRPTYKHSCNLDDIEQHLIAIKLANRSKKIYTKSILEKMLQKQWFYVLNRSSTKNKLSKFVSSQLFSIRFFDLKQLIKLYSN